MNIIEKVNSDFFGELVCLSDDNGNPLFWAKQIKQKFLSEKEEILTIALDLYCYNKEFVSSLNEEKTRKICEQIKQQYDNFLNDCRDFEQIFISEFCACKEEWDIEEEITTNEDIYSKIKVIQVDIVKDSYIVSFELNGEEWALIKECSEETPEYFYLNPREEAQFAEMKY